MEAVSYSLDESSGPSSNFWRVRGFFLSEEAALQTSSHRHAHIIGEVEVYPSFPVLPLIIRHKAEDLSIILIPWMANGDMSWWNANARVVRWRRSSVWLEIIVLLRHSNPLLSVLKVSRQSCD